MPRGSTRPLWRRLLDFCTFPARALAVHERDRWWGSSLATERMDHAQREVQGYCLDIGCGPGNRFITEFLSGDGVGVDVYPYPGLTKRNIVADMTHLPLADGTFDSVAFIASINHVPRRHRAAEMREAFRVLKPGGNVIVTMGVPTAEILAHWMSALYSRFLPGYQDMDAERGMDQGEEHYLRRKEIEHLLRQAGFGHIRKSAFRTQWWLNRLFVGRKPLDAPATARLP